MDIFIDTADLDQIKEAYAWGIVDGVTTNPSLIKKAVDKLKSKGQSTSIAEYIEQILLTAKGDPVSLEVIGATEEDMYAQGMFLYERFNPVANNVVVKIPVNPDMTGDGKAKSAFDGLKVIKKMADQGIRINTTLIFTPEQAMLAAKAGAAFLSPFAGRVDDDLRTRIGKPFQKDDYYAEEGVDGVDDCGIVSGVDLIAGCVDIVETYGFEARVLAASVRNPRQVRECAHVGSHVATLPFEVIRKLIDHPKTVEGMKTFTKDIVPEYASLFK
jgi:transaldolase